MEEKIINIISRYTTADSAEITSDTDIIQKLDISSLDLINIINEIEEEFEVEVPFQSIRDITAFLAKLTA